MRLREMIVEALGGRPHGALLTALLRACYRELLRSASRAPGPADRAGWIRCQVEKVVAEHTAACTQEMPELTSSPAGRKQADPQPPRSYCSAEHLYAIFRPPSSPDGSSIF